MLHIYWMSRITSIYYELDKLLLLLYFSRRELDVYLHAYSQSYITISKPFQHHGKCSCQFCILQGESLLCESIIKPLGQFLLLAYLIEWKLCGPLECYTDNKQPIFDSYVCSV